MITVPIYTRVLSPADYGALDLLSYFSVLLPLIMGAGLDQAVGRFYLDTNDDQEKKRIASTVFIFNIVIFSLLIPIVLPLSKYLAHNWLDDQISVKTIILVFAFTWVHALFYIANNQLKYLFLSREYAVSNIGNTVISTILSFIFIVNYKLGIFGVFLGQIIGQGIFTIISLYYARNCYGFIFHIDVLKKMLTYSLPLVPGTLAFYVMQYFDRYALNDLNSLQDVGIYGIGARVATLVNLFLMGFQGAWHPLVMDTFRESDAKYIFRNVFNYYLYIVLIILIGLSLFSKEILMLFTTKVFSEGFVVVPLLVLAAILASIGGYFTYGIQIEKKSHYRLMINIATVLLNIILNYLLIPFMGIVGAALATVFSFLFLSIISMIISQKLYHVPYKWLKVFSVFIFAVVISHSVIFITLEFTWLLIITKICITILSVLVLSRLLEVPIIAKLNNI